MQSKKKIKRDPNVIPVSISSDEKNPFSIFDSESDSPEKKPVSKKKRVFSPRFKDANQISPVYFPEEINFEQFVMDYTSRAVNQDYKPEEVRSDVDWIPLDFRDLGKRIKVALNKDHFEFFAQKYSDLNEETFFSKIDEVEAIYGKNFESCKFYYDANKFIIPPKSENHEIPNPNISQFICENKKKKIALEKSIIFKYLKEGKSMTKVSFETKSSLFKIHKTIKCIERFGTLPSLIKPDIPAVPLPSFHDIDAFLASEWGVNGEIAPTWEVACQKLRDKFPAFSEKSFTFLVSYLKKNHGIRSMPFRNKMARVNTPGFIQRVY